MIFLKEFDLPFNEDDALDKRTIHTSHYPLGIFTEIGIRHFDFREVTVFYGGNGIGKTTLLKVIAAKVNASRKDRDNQGNIFRRYVDLCSHEIINASYLREIKLLSSDDVFDELLDLRALNSGINRKKDILTDEYYSLRETTATRGFDSNNEESSRLLADSVDAKRMTQSAFIRSRLSRNNLQQYSNGESSMQFWEREIQDNGIYLLDEPENSLAPVNQVKLKQYIEDSVRFYNCQFIISTHSPFLLGIEDARIYDLDHNGQITRWEDLESIKTYNEFFRHNQDRFK